MTENHTSNYYYPYHAEGHHRQPSSSQSIPITPRTHQNAIVAIDICDRATNHSHGPYYLARAAVEKESRELLVWLARDQPLSLVDSSSRGYSCCILDCIIKSWRTGERFQGFEPGPGMQPIDEVTQLIELSRALWDYQCQTSWFEDFAKNVRDRYFQYDHFNKVRCQEWAFISVVFSWQDEFGRAAMDVAELGHPWHSEQLQMNGPIRNPWTSGPVDLAVLRYIIPMNFYLYVQHSASEFIDSTWTRLCRGRTARDAQLHDLAIRMEEHFAQSGYMMPRDDDSAPSMLRTPSVSSGGSANSPFFQHHSAVDLWRIFESFFPRGEPEPRRQPRPTSGRVRRPPFRFWRGRTASRRAEETGEDITALRENVEAWYNKTFRELLFQPSHVHETFGNVLWRFNEARKATLIVSGASHVMEPQIQELPASPDHVPSAEPSGANSRSQAWQANGLPRRHT